MRCCRGVRNLSVVAVIMLREEHYAITAWWGWTKFNVEMSVSVSLIVLPV